MKYITQTIETEVCQINLKMVIPFSNGIEHSINGLEGEEWGFISNPVLFADVVDNSGDLLFTLKQKEFKEHIKIDISGALNLLKFKVEYYLRSEFPLNEGTDWYNYALMMQKNHLSRLSTIFEQGK